MPQISDQFRQLANPKKATDSARFFKTGPGEYSEGDQFLGIPVPQTREFARDYFNITRAEIDSLISSPFHEERLLSLIILVRQFEKGTPAIQQKVFNYYFKKIRFINNWDLVDVSAPQIVGTFLAIQPTKEALTQMITWASSKNLWVRRIAIVSTLTLIRKNQFKHTLTLVKKLKKDPHDLIHKACGWMLREVGKQDEKVLISFLEKEATTLPRTTLRYAIERLSTKLKKYFLEKR